MMDKLQNLANEIALYIRTRRDKKEEAFYKNKPKKNKQGVVVNGAFNSRLMSIVKRLSASESAISLIEKEKKLKEKTLLQYQQEKYKKLLNILPADIVDLELSELDSEKKQFLLDLDKEFEPEEWLTQWTPKARDISFATHVAKLTHSSSKGSSILDTTSIKDERYLTTNTLSKPVVDTASSNAASLPIADVLKLSVDGVSVLDCLKSGETSLFRFLTKDDQLVEVWCQNLKQAYDSHQKQSYFLNKQTYFPVREGGYHLLLPLKSSSLIHEIHLEHKKYFDEEQTKAREQRKNKQYSPINVRAYPNKAYLHVTGSHHSNASSLNGQRGGRVALFSAMPPQWQSNMQPVAIKDSIFDRDLGRYLKDDIRELEKYLLVIKKEELSISKPVRNAAVVKKLRIINESFFSYVQLCKSGEQALGWTISSNLPIEQQLLFEPEREDEKAVSIKMGRAWMKSLGSSYGRWLNNQLKDKQLTLTPIHSELWGRHFLQDLREYIAIQEAEL